MADKKISELTALTAANTDATDLLVIVDTTASETKKMTVAEAQLLFADGAMVYPSAGIAVSTGSAWGTSKTTPTGDIVGTSDNQTLTTKTINLSSNTLTGTKAQFDTACSDGNFVYTDAIGVSVQAYDADLSAIAALTPTADNFIVGNGTTWILETPAQVRTSLGVTTIGDNLFRLTNPSAITFPRFNADNTVTALTAANFRTAIGAGTGNGTVTSVGWTGGIVSVATGTTTPAFTIAGTSGGIPYFSSGTTWATSAALAANALVVGGGAGAAPATITTGSGVVTALGVAANGSGGFVTDTGSVTLTNKTINLTSNTLSGTKAQFDTALSDDNFAYIGTANTFTATNTFKGVTSTVFTITDGAAFEINPANGEIQVITLGANRTPSATNFGAGQVVLLGIDDGTAYTITWTTVAVTWVKAGGTASAPTLATTGFTWVLLWKVGSTIYGCEVGKP